MKMAEEFMSPHRRLQNDGSNLWAVGVVLVLCGSVGNNLGNALVALAHKRSQQAEQQQQSQQRDGAAAAAAAAATGLETGNPLQPTPSSPPQSERCSLRTVGTLVFVVGSLLTFAAFGFAAQSLLASLESIQFVSNVVFMRYVHKEVITWRMLVSTAAIVAGNTLVVVFSDHSAALLTSAELIHLYATNTSYWGYLVCAMVLWCVTHLTYTRYYNARVTRGVMLWKHSFVEPFTFAVSSAIIGTQAVLNSKCMSMLIQVTSRGIVNEFELPHIWWILITWIILVAYWLRRLDVGLAMFPPMFIIPVMQVFFVFFAILCGGIYFQEFDNFTTTMYIGFVIGVLMILGGVYGLAPTDVQIQPGKVEAETASPLVEATAVAVPLRGGDGGVGNSGGGGGGDGGGGGSGAISPRPPNPDEEAASRQLLLLQMEALEAFRSSFGGRASSGGQGHGQDGQDRWKVAAAAAVEAVHALEPLVEGPESSRFGSYRGALNGAGTAGVSQVVLGGAITGPPAVSSRRPSLSSLPQTSPVAPSNRSRRSSFLPLHSSSPVSTPHKVAPAPSSPTPTAPATSPMAASAPLLVTLTQMPVTPDKMSPLFTRETLE